MPFNISIDFPYYFAAFDDERDTCLKMIQKLIRLKSSEASRLAEHELCDVMQQFHPDSFEQHYEHTLTCGPCRFMVSTFEFHTLKCN